MKNSIGSGFSLIELMVVIAIVAILAAVSVPAYKSYILQARTNEIVKLTGSLAQKSIIYSQKRGHFGTAYDLGLSSTLDSGTVDNPADFLPSSYFANGGSINLGDGSSGIANCGAMGYARIEVDASAIGIPGIDGAGDGSVHVIQHFYNINGVITPYNYYIVSTSSAPVAGDFISGVSNYYISANPPTTNPDVIDRLTTLDAASVCQ